MQYPILSQSLRSFRQKYITVEVGGPRPREASGELGCWHVDNEGIRDLCHEPLFVVEVIPLCRSCRSPSFSCFRLAHSHRAGTASQSPHCYFHNRDKGGQQCFCNTYAPQTYQQKYQSEESKRKSFLLPSLFRSQLTVNYCGHPPLFLTPPSFVARQLFQKVSTIRINMQAVALNSQIPNLHAKYPRRIYTHLLSTCNPASFSHASLMHHTMQKGMHCRKNQRSSRSITCSKIPVRDATHIQRRTQPSTRHCAVL